MTEQLTALTDGLYFMSESDYPIEVISHEIKAETADDLLAQLVGNEKLTTSITAFLDIDTLFQNALKVEDWMGDYEKEIAQKFQDLVNFIKTNCTEVKVCKIGEVEKEVYIIGHTLDNQWVVLKTMSIET